MTATATQTKWTQKVLKWLKGGASEMVVDIRFLKEMAALLDTHYLDEVERHEADAKEDGESCAGPRPIWAGPRNTVAMINQALTLFHRRDRVSIAVAGYELLRLSTAADEMEETGELSHDLVSNPAVIMSVLF